MNLGFNQGHWLQDPKQLLKGEGKQNRYYRMGTISEFPLEYMTQMIDNSWMNTQTALKPKAKLIQGQTIIKQKLELERG